MLEWRARPIGGLFIASLCAFASWGCSSGGGTSLDSGAGAAEPGSGGRADTGGAGGEHSGGAQSTGGSDGASGGSGAEGSDPTSSEVYCPLQPPNEWVSIPAPPWELTSLNAPPTVGGPGTPHDWVAGTLDDKVLLFERSSTLVYVFDTCSRQWETKDLGWKAELDGLWVNRWARGHFLTSTTGDLIWALDPTDGSVEQVPSDFAEGPSEIPPEPISPGGLDDLPFPSVPEELAEATEGLSGVQSSQGIIGVWTGSKKVKWGVVYDTAEGCDNLPADFMGGCDPLYRRYYVFAGGMLTPDYDR